MTQGRNTRIAIVHEGYNSIRCPMCKKGEFARFPISLRCYWYMRASGMMKTIVEPETTCGHKIVVSVKAVGA